MIDLVTKDECNNTNRKDHQIDDYCSVVEMEFIGNRGRALKSLELVQFASRDCSSSTRVGSRTVAGADDVVLFQIEAAHLRLMDSSTVVSTGRGSSESLDLPLLSFSIEGDDAHRVSCFNIVNFMPTNSMSRERIDNLQTFVIEDYRGMKKYLIEDCAYERTPDCCDHATCKTEVKEIDVDKQANKEEAQEGKDIGTRRPEEFAVIHEEIFSCEIEKRAA